MGGPDDGIPVPAGVHKLDYELEIACVIGKRGKDIPAERGLDHIFGLTIYNDLTARDYSREMENMMGPAKAKDFDGSNIIGPWIVTLDSSTWRTCR
jgi:2-keto-4-pentenoate hydratase/2-oxohepta-3-ene-1,7-dioic acid hydratase in catechol pathway